MVEARRGRGYQGRTQERTIDHLLTDQIPPICDSRMTGTIVARVEEAEVVEAKEEIDPEMIAGILLTE